MAPAAAAPAAGAWSRRPRAEAEAFEGGDLQAETWVGKSLFHSWKEEQDEHLDFTTEERELEKELAIELAALESAEASVEALRVELRQATHDAQGAAGGLSQLRWLARRWDEAAVEGLRELEARARRAGDLAAVLPEGALAAAEREDEELQAALDRFRKRLLADGYRGPRPTSARSVSSQPSSTSPPPSVGGISETLAWSVAAQESYPLPPDDAWREIAGALGCPWSLSPQATSRTPASSVSGVSDTLVWSSGPQPSAGTPGSTSGVSDTLVWSVSPQASSAGAPASASGVSETLAWSVSPQPSSAEAVYSAASDAAEAPVVPLSSPTTSPRRTPSEASGPDPRHAVVIPPAIAYSAGSRSGAVSEVPSSGGDEVSSTGSPRRSQDRTHILMQHLGQLKSLVKGSHEKLEGLLEQRKEMEAFTETLSFGCELQRSLFQEARAAANEAGLLLSNRSAAAADLTSQIEGLRKERVRLRAEREGLRARLPPPAGRAGGDDGPRPGGRAPRSRAHEASLALQAEIVRLKKDLRSCALEVELLMQHG